MKISSSPVTIALDVDGVLADVILVWLKLYNSKYKAHLTLQNVTKWDFWMPAGIDRSTFYRIFSQAWRMWKEIPPTEENLGEKIRILTEKVRVDIVTGRSRDTVPHVKQWLSNQRIPYNNFVAVPSTRQKACLDYTIFIDDAPNVALAVARRGGFVALYDQPWNREVPECASISRVKELVEVYGLIDCISKT